MRVARETGDDLLEARIAPQRVPIGTRVSSRRNQQRKVAPHTSPVVAGPGPFRRPRHKSPRDAGEF